MLPWHMNIIFIIGQNSNPCVFVPGILENRMGAGIHRPAALGMTYKQYIMHRGFFHPYFSDNCGMIEKCFKLLFFLGNLCVETMIL